MRMSSLDSLNFGLGLSINMQICNASGVQLAPALMKSMITHKFIIRSFVSSGPCISGNEDVSRFVPCPTFRILVNTAVFPAILASGSPRVKKANSDLSPYKARRTEIHSTLVLPVVLSTAYPFAPMGTAAPTLLLEGNEGAIGSIAARIHESIACVLIAKSEYNRIDDDPSPPSDAKDKHRGYESQSEYACSVYTYQH